MRSLLTRQPQYRGMATRTVILDTTIASDSSATSSAVDINNDTTATFQIEGDADTTDIDIRVDGRIDTLDNWAELDEINENLTVYVNNNLLLQYDVLDLEQFRVHLTNNAANQINPKIISSHSDQA